MDARNAEKEVSYQLIKLLLLNLQREKLITGREAETVRKLAQEQCQPLIGVLDRDHYGA